ncbi:HupE/UreJ family protein [Flavicella marina]|uniref:HupE/UreJ family protein n=1 Tax=Flavicella marina TaxID=1475951 RepID=UPI0012655060|nr:HupE/UreJ family protein [Flavicella marina]
MRKYLLCLMFFSLISSVLFAHEKTPVSLQVKVDGETTEICFKSPILRNGKSAIDIQIPSAWHIVSFHVSEIDNVEITDIRIETPSFDKPIVFERQTGIKSDLIINLSYNGQISTEILELKATSWYVKQASSFDTFIEFITLGFKHILIGADHLLFVLALFFLVSGRKLLWAITSFTLAHSLTLALSSFHVINLNTQVVEALIAFSILLLGVELLEGNKKNKGLIVMTFVFGLLHGLGFANVLFGIGMPKTQIPISLFAFNLGVEFGQIAFILSVFFLYKIITKFVEKRKVAVAAAMIIGSMGAFWFIDRTYSIFF